MNVSQRSAILIVDDDTTTGWVLGNLLKQIVPEYPVQYCIYGLEALAYLATHPVCIVITDYHMPSMDGLTFAEILLAKWPTIPVILMTGMPRAILQSQSQTRTTNTITLLEKPLSIDALRATLLPLLATSDSQ